jgi:hypothetical protein
MTPLHRVVGDQPALEGGEEFGAHCETLTEPPTGSAKWPLSNVGVPENATDPQVIDIFPVDEIPTFPARLT